ncbi:hypothetical protein C8R42DRAFT_569719 [Lentinula raphanica]|nr:hypothetical protein C8R42DRAFT_569719 [Lentinula raphanica]
MGLPRSNRCGSGNEELETDGLEPGQTEVDERDLMFSVTTPFERIRHARPALTSFAAQLVAEHLLEKFNELSSPEGGLHTSKSDVPESSSNEQTFGAETFHTAQNLLRVGHPLLWHYCVMLATPQSRNRVSRAKDAPAGTRAISRNYRPPETVATYAISSLLFSKNRNANLLPAEKGLLLFACGANRYLFDHESRIGALTNYTTVLDALDRYAKADHQAILKIARSTDESGVLRFDNMQKQVHARFERIGREARMMIGCAGTYVKAEGKLGDALSLEKKREWLKKDLRSTLTFPALWKLVDHPFLNNALPLLWLDILFDYTMNIPNVQEYSASLRKTYEEIGTKSKVSPRKNQIYPLKSNGYNETTTSELLKALKDFFAQLGQSPNNFVKRLILAGGDGLSYERMVQLKNYLQFQENEFERMELLEPFLEVWHTVWTNLSRIYEAHWVGLTSADPSTLGFGANTLKRKAPGNVSKVDYYRYMDLLETQVEARVLDIWRMEFDADDLLEHLKMLSETRQFPSFDDLHKVAVSLHHRFGSPKAFTKLMRHGTGYKEGSEWKVPRTDKSLINIGLPSESKGKKKKTKKADQESENEVFVGDETLARSTQFICDGLLSRLATEGIHRGDVGCVWECLKMMTFTFAGSSHTKYTGYLLEMICNLELESSPQLRDFFFENWLISTNGHSFEAGDLFQEQLQEELYEHVNHDQGFDNFHTRERLSPNVYRFRQTKKVHHASLGLANRAGNHLAPSRIAEIRKLTTRYQLEELHLFRKGRQYREADPDRTDDLGRGIASLAQGRLQKWIHDTCWVRNLNEATEHLEDQNMSHTEIHIFDAPVQAMLNNDQLRKDGFAFDPDSAIEQDSDINFGESEQENKE